MPWPGLSQYCDLNVVQTCTTVYECVMSVCLYTTADTIAQCYEREGKARRAERASEPAVASESAVAGEAAAKPPESAPPAGAEDPKPVPKCPPPGPGGSPGGRSPGGGADRQVSCCGGHNWDRTIRGAICNLISGGGAINWYWWLYLDRVIPGHTIKAVLIKSSIDCFLWMPIWNVVFLVIYNWSREDCDYALGKVRQDVFKFSLWEIPVAFSQDVVTFFLSGWPREVVSDILSISCDWIGSYFVNKPLLDRARLHDDNEEEEAPAEAPKN
eukprot:Hpha_TRINITY_DN16825_c2_g7::TRINITY_DN16825_c2_g7_i1::g.148935::m.148935